MKLKKDYEFWFITGSQHLYGDKTLKQVKENSIKISDFLNASTFNSIKFKALVTTPDEISTVCKEANNDENCGGLITWMHTFSPSKMWITGLTNLKKPLLHLHTQFNRDIPWDSIDMDFMNLNQSAHGDREFGFMLSRLRLNRKVVVGYYKEEEVINKIDIWMNTAIAYQESLSLKVARFGDNMREVAVTEGDKVEAQIKFGWSVNGYGIGDLVKYVMDVSDSEVNNLMDEYNDKYSISDEILTSKELFDSIKEQGKIELGMKNFLEEGSFGAFTTTFENLYGLKQLPGLAVQRLMEQGYGFGGEGDWKTSALVRLMKIMNNGLPEGTSFMEDYTYHFEPDNQIVLGAHMLEICPCLASDRPKIEVHPLSIGGKDDPARIVFNGRSGKALNASLIDMGNRFRLIVNIVNAIEPEMQMPNLPVARLLWKPEPNLNTAAEAWILAGGAHHTAFSFAVTLEHLISFAEMTNIECVIIDKNTNINNFKNELRWNEISYK